MCGAPTCRADPLAAAPAYPPPPPPSHPTLEAFGAVAPGFLALASPFLEETRLKWEFLQQVGPLAIRARAICARGRLGGWGGLWGKCGDVVVESWL